MLLFNAATIHQSKASIIFQERHQLINLIFIKYIKYILTNNVIQITMVQQ